MVPTQGVLRLHQVLQKGPDLLQRRPSQPRVLQRVRVQRVDAAARGTASSDATSGKHFQTDRKLDSKWSNHDLKLQRLRFFI